MSGLTGSVDDSYDNVFAESVICRFRPGRIGEHVEFEILFGKNGSITDGCMSRLVTSHQPSSKRSAVGVGKPRHDGLTQPSGLQAGLTRA